MSLADQLAALPAEPGVYIFKDARGAFLYVGKARVLRDRVRSYFQAARALDPRKTLMAQQVADIDVILTDNEIEALALENNLIKRHRPHYNVLLRDDKNHPYLKLTSSEAYPRLRIVRRVTEDGDTYGGPYIPAALARRTAALAHQIFGIRACSEELNGRRARPCLQYQIGRCLAPCVADVCPLPRYIEACRRAALFLEGQSDEVVRHLREEMEAAAAAQRFEEARTKRDQIRAIERAATPQKITNADLEERDVFGLHQDSERAAIQVFAVRDGKVVGRDAFLLDRLAEPERVLDAVVQQYYGYGRYIPGEIVLPRALVEQEVVAAWLAARRGSRVRLRIPQRGEKLRLAELVERNARLAFDLEWRHPRRQTHAILRALRDLLELEDEPRRIECFDISNIQGADCVASMVCFSDGQPRKSDYRKFRVKGAGDHPDDFAAMREVVGRRYRRLLEEGRPLPDLIVVDGGLGQISAAGAALDELGLGEQKLISLAKREEQLYVRGSHAPITLPRDSPVLQLIQRARDEAHRFAVRFHRETRKRRTLQSELDAIPGIGVTRRRQLLARFGSARGVKTAALDALTKAVGPALAARIRAHFEGPPGRRE